MSDVVITPANVGDFKTGKIIPVYLVVLENNNSIKAGKETYFLATKFDESNNYIKAVGFYTTASMDKIISNYDELIKTTDKTNFVEMMFTWSRVISIRSLIYRQK